MKFTLPLIVQVIAVLFTIASADIIEVTTTNVQGPGSLSEAIDIANSDPSLTNIKFNILGGGRIVTGSSGWFPEIATWVEIDGANDDGLVTLVGSSPTGPGAPVSGLVFISGAEKSLVKNITAEGFLYAIDIKTNAIAVSNCKFIKTFAHAIKIDNSISHLIEKNSFEDIGSLAIRIINSSNIGILENNFTTNDIVTSFLLLENCQNITVGIPGRGNSFDGNTSNANGAIMMVGSGENSEVLGNSFKNADGSAIFIAGRDQKNHYIASNSFENNKGWDIKVLDGHKLTIERNTIIGDPLAFEAGIYLEGVDSATIGGNTIDGARISLKMSNHAIIGGVRSYKNIIKNDSQGFSGSAGIILDSANNCSIINNDIKDNASNGIILQNHSSKSVILYNTISNNGRTAIKVISGNGNKIGQNILFGQHADAQGGINSISLLGDANDNKEAPVITSIEPSYDENTLLVSGEGIPGEVIELCKSTRPLSSFSIEAVGELGFSMVGQDGKWAANVDVSYITDPVLYVTASATDGYDNSSELSGVASYILNDGIVGPTNVSRGVLYNYAVQDFPGVQYDWWVNGDVRMTGWGTSSIDLIFNNFPQTTLQVNVGFTHPENGWTVKTIDVTIVD